MHPAVRFLHGAIGGLIPPLAGLFVSLQTGNVKQDDLIRAAFMGLILAPICGYYAYLQSSETSPLKLLQISLGVPALLTAITADVKRTQTVKELEQRNRVQEMIPKPAAALPAPTPARNWISPPGGWFTPATVYAAPPPGSNTRILHKSEQSWGGRIAQAVLGPSDPSEFFVVAGTYGDEADAKAAAQQIRQSFPNYAANVYSLPDTKGPYAVTIGDHLTYNQAMTLQKNAVGAGLPASTFPWTFGIPLRQPIQDNFLIYQRCWRELSAALTPNLYVYLSDVSRRETGFRLYLVSSPKAWPVEKRSLSEKDFLKLTANLPSTRAFFSNSGGRTTIKHGNAVFLIKALEVELGGNERVRFEIVRLL